MDPHVGRVGPLRPFKLHRHERVASSQAEDCGRAFVPQPGYSTRLCIAHDRALKTAPECARAYKADQASRCAQCGECLVAP